MREEVKEKAESPVVIWISVKVGKKGGEGRGNGEKRRKNKEKREEKGGKN